MSYDTFLDAYIECLLWSESDTDDNGNSPSGWGNFEWATMDDFSLEALKEIKQDCKGFYDSHGDNFKDQEAQAGHDFCLTRNGHGAGFWDGNWPKELGNSLTQASEPYGTQGLYLGDDGKLYTHG